MHWGKINGYVIAWGIIYLALKLIVRWVWYRPEHLRPGFLRHAFIIRSTDFVALLILMAVAFFLVNVERWWKAGIIIACLIGWDLVLRQLFLHIEARRICAHSTHWDIKSAKRRLRRRVRNESPF